MGQPPLEAGAVQETAAEALPAVATTPVGEPGTVDGVTLLEAIEGKPVPTPLVAVTVNVYGVPFVRVETVHESGPVVQVQVLPPGDEVTV